VNIVIDFLFSWGLFLLIFLFGFKFLDVVMWVFVRFDFGERIVRGSLERSVFFLTFDLGFWDLLRIAGLID
jgi:hypothetical protein